MAEKKKLSNFEQEQINTMKQIVSFMQPVEANIVSSLYKKPDLLHDVSLVLEDFHNNIWKVYFQIISELILSEEKQKIDEIVVGIYLDKHTNLKAKYVEYGGYKTISNSIKYIKIENFQAYLTELKKWQCVLELCKKGFPVKDRLSEFADMNTEAIYDEYETYLNHIFVSINENVTSYNVFDGIYDYLDNITQHNESGFPFYNASILNDVTGGFNINGNIYGLGAGSGVGKSTMAFNWLVPSAIENKESIVFIINEEDEKKFKKELLIWVANNKIVTKKEDYIHKYMIRDANFDEHTSEIIMKAAEWIDAKKKECLFYVIPLEKYSANTVIKLIKKYSSIGVKIFVLDTLKESFDAKTDEIYKSMMRDMIALYDVVKPSAKNVGLFVTYQLGKSSLKMRHLTNNEIGQAKSILDVMSVNLMMRRPYEDEYDSDKKALKCYKKEGKNSKIEYKLKKENKPMIIFVTKNRFGLTDVEQIIAECDFSTNKCKDVAYCVVPQDW